MVGLIPARAGSKRVEGKNMRMLAGHPLLAYTIKAAQDSGVFAQLVVCSDDEAAINYATNHACGAFWRMPVSDAQPDVVWVSEAFAKLKDYGLQPDAFAILRPTSPFRTAETIRRAYAQFTAPDFTADSLRAVQPALEHPGKCWALNDGMITPLLDYKRSDGVPWHSCPTQTLPVFYSQNSSLEMGRATNVTEHRNIHGRTVAPFFTEGYEGFSIDYPEQWAEAERLIETGAVEPLRETL